MPAIRYPVKKIVKNLHTIEYSGGTGQPQGAFRLCLMSRKRLCANFVMFELRAIGNQLYQQR